MVETERSKVVFFHKINKSADHYLPLEIGVPDPQSSFTDPDSRRRILKKTKQCLIHHITIRYGLKVLIQSNYIYIHTSGIWLFL
jgi:hypothetical protein